MSTVRFDVDGSFTFVHDDDVAEIMAAVGPSRICRASHVEPDEDGSWWADLAPVGGPILGPFRRRDEALREELEWLAVNLIEKEEEER